MTEEQHGLIKGFMFRLVKKHLAGSTLSSALQQVRANQSCGMHTTVTFLNDKVDDPTKARYNANTYVQLARQASRLHLDADISLRLSQLGFPLGDNVFDKCITDVMNAASDSDTRVWLESEDSIPIENLLGAYREYRKRYKNLGVELPVEYQLEASTVKKHLRSSDMVKLTAYTTVAKTEKPKEKKAKNGKGNGGDKAASRHLYESYISHISKLLGAGVGVAVLEHDEKLVARIAGFSKEYKKDLIFELPLGFSKRWLAKLQKMKINLSVYTPYGKDWGAFLLNRQTAHHGHMHDIAAKVLESDESLDEDYGEEGEE